MSSRPNAKTEKVSYTFPAVAGGEGGSMAHPSANNCHRSGVNALAVDSTRSILYSAGRDSSVRAWSYGNHSLLKNSISSHNSPTLPDAHETVCFYHMDYHSDWVNDLALLQDGSKLVSCGSDGKIVVSNVQSIFEDPWSSILSQSPQFQSPKPSNPANAMDVSEPGDANGGVVGDSRPHVSLPYSQLVAHADYAKKVKCEQGGSDSELMIFSIGLDGQLKLSAMRPEGGPLSILQAYNTKTSQYSLSVMRHNEGWLVATGGSDGIVRIFDSRDDKKHVAKLKGHSDVVKCLLSPSQTFSGNNHRLISGSADGSIRVWDLRVGKTLTSLALHEDSVWSLAECKTQRDAGSDANGDHNGGGGMRFYSGGRDGTVYLTNIDTNETQFLFKEDYPVLALAPTDHSTGASTPTGNGSSQQGEHSNATMWVATTDACITHWELSNHLVGNVGEGDSERGPRTPRQSTLILASSPAVPGVSSAVLSMSPGLGNMLEVAQQPSSPLLSTQQAISKTPKRAAIVSHHILPDRHRVVTRDSSGRVQVWNVVDLTLEQDLGVVESIDAVLPALQNKRFLPSWFSAETRTGQLTIHIDPPPRCLDSTFTPLDQILRYTREADRNHESACGNALKRIFRRYILARTDAELAQDALGKSQLSRPSTFAASRTNQNRPPKELPPENRILPALAGELDVIVTITKDNTVVTREHANNMSLDSYVPQWVWHTVTHEVDKPESQTIVFTFYPKRAKAIKLGKEYTMRRTFTARAMMEFVVSKFNTPSRVQQLTVDDVQILLNDVEIPPTMDLGSIKHYLWKGSGTIPLVYDYPEHLD